ncbi:hypothetical protein EJ05DRAFT_477507 [Pseudovirgaria hyperparasitica]|uniref:Uncharacterized protein n=1 Tax=Pseudovirgaria hyperparasitica TaxID=470096 RepID=A0A6A6W2W7_9PEZI|nr:uncharacterized protein EJ05DRAFT_477507 [Pseudovirgaria hyperparasitica]KAF2756336.1 hypothetical protein EJ05DRAFT_477507 [Pseudovirgaria hyperparasitica]
MAEELPTATPKLSHTPVAFISGPLEVTWEYFNTYYKDRIDNAFNQGHSFVVGPVDGIDKLALVYIVDKLNNTPREEDTPVDRSRVDVFMGEFELGRRHEVEDILGKRVTVATERVGEMVKREPSWARDAAMTVASSYDIVRWRTEDEQKLAYEFWRPRISNTEHNVRRRAHYMALKSYDETQQTYIRHIDPTSCIKPTLPKKSALARFIAAFFKGTTGQPNDLTSHRKPVEQDSSHNGYETCNGQCDGHRDEKAPDTFNKPFGFGSDGRYV